MNVLGFTEAESIPYMGLLLLVGYILITNYRKGFMQLWSPLTMVAVIFAYYCLLGPYSAVVNNLTSDRLLNMRPFYESAFWGALISMISVIVGFQVNRKPSRLIMRVFSNEDLSFYGKVVFFTGLILYIISTKGDFYKLINPLDADVNVESIGGSYFHYSLNFTIPGIALLFAYYIRTRKELLWFAIPFAIILGLFVTLGFRYRIVLLVGSLAITYYLLIRKRPNLILAAIGVITFISAMGIIDLTRNYNRGLDLNKLGDSDTQEYYNNGLNEARIFQTSGAVIDFVPLRVPYAGFEPIVATLLFPIPRSVYQDKGSGEYVFNVLEKIYGKKESRGAAFMMFAEYYLAFGWIGLVLGSFLLGWFYKKLWSWYLINWQNPLITVTYASTVIYLYVIMSRGYLPQVTMLFFFSVFPIYVVVWHARRKYNSIAQKRILQRAV